MSKLSSELPHAHPVQGETGGGTDKQERIDRLEKLAEDMFAGLDRLRASQDRTDAQILELKESQAKTDQQLNKTIRKLDRIGQQLGDLGLVQGEVAEDLFTCRMMRGALRS